MRILDLKEDNYGAILTIELNTEEIELLRVSTGYFNIEDAILQVLEEAMEKELADV